MGQALRLFVVVCFLTIPSPLTARQHPPSEAPCRVTTPNGAMAGVPEPHEGSHGNRVLSVGPFGLWPDGTIVFKPGGAGFVTRDGALGMKFGWTRAVRGKLVVTGHRVDGSDAPLLFESDENAYDEIGFQASYLIFPTPGCWQVAAQIDGREDSGLTFVTKVVKIGEGPSWHREPRAAPASQR